VCLLLLTGNFWLPKITEIVVGKMSGFEVAVEKSDGSLFRGRIDIEDFKIKNPRPIFKNENFLKFNRLTADIDMGSLVTNEIVVEELAIDIDAISIVKNANGTSNYLLFGKNLLSHFPKDKSSEKKVSSMEKSPKSKQKNSTNKKKKSLCLRKFVLSIGTVRIIDEASNSRQEFKANYSREFTNIRDFSSLKIALIADLGRYGLSMLVDPIISTVTGLPNASIDEIIKIKDFPSETVNKVGSAAGSIGDTIGKGVKKLFKRGQ
jgi:hypothetical protein